MHFDAKFIKSVYLIKDLPKDNIPAIALCGRSNVGKSTFINSLSKHSSIAKVSSTPGKTRSINFYLFQDKFYIVDLPGYGYAKTSKEERESWKKIINEFFVSYPAIAQIFHFVDSRHDPTELDINLNALLRSTDLPYTVLLSKVDKLKQSEIAHAKKNIITFFPELSLGDNLLLYSSINASGKKEIVQRLKNLF